MAKGSNKVQEPVLNVKKKSVKPRVKKDVRPEQEIVKPKKKIIIPKKIIPNPNPLDRIKPADPQKERIVAQPIKKQPQWTNSTHIAPMPKRDPDWPHIGQMKSPRSPAPERKKEAEMKRAAEVAPPKQINTSPSRAQAVLVEMAQSSRFDIPHQRLLHGGLSALAAELPNLPLPLPQAPIVQEHKSFGESSGKVEEVVGVREGDGEGEMKEMKVLPSAPMEEEVVTRVVFTEVSDSTEPRVMELFQDWRPGALRIGKPPSVDRNHWLAVEIEKQQDRRKLAQKPARKKKQVRYLEGVGEDTPFLRDTSQMIPDFSIEESARGYAEFLYRPGASWMNTGSTTTSLRDYDPLDSKTRPNSCDPRKTTVEIVCALSSASARREVLRKHIVERIRQDLVRKKLVLSQQRVATKHASRSCRCC